jgi:hypothetical protein
MPERAEDKRRNFMIYTQQQIDDFWWGVGGSASNPQPGAYFNMSPVDVIQKSNRESAAYDAAWTALLNYLYMQGAVLRTGVGPTGANGFADVSTIGGVRIDVIG